MATLTKWQEAIFQDGLMNKQENNMKHYAVMGHPVNHSLSPDIHAQFAEQTKISLKYNAIDVPVDNFEKAVRTFFDNGAGLNITLPFKAHAWKLTDKVTERAEIAQTVNTLWYDYNQNEIHGDNTDGVGLVKDIICNNDFKIKDKRILLIGSGGAVKGVIQPILDKKPHSITLINRTYENAVKLAEYFQQKDQKNIVAEKTGETKGTFDLIINGTSTGLQGVLPPIPEDAISKTTIVYDMMYGDNAKLLLKWAADRGALKTVDGLGMLVEQASEAFYIWHGVYPETQRVIQAIRSRS